MADIHIDIERMIMHSNYLLEVGKSSASDGLSDMERKQYLDQIKELVQTVQTLLDANIALGNKNDGGIAYEPPINRDTKLPGSVTTYAISGRSADAQGNVVTSNWLFDALEAWGYWANTIVPKVADALWAAGLKYNNIQ